MSLLESLYIERAALIDKLRKVNDLISAYGGQVNGEAFAPVMAPVATTAQKTPPELFREQPASTQVPEPVASYPRYGTWKDKILYVLAWYKKPVIVAEIVDKILELEPVLSDKDLPVTIGQYCSVMGKNEEIFTDKSDYRNKYALLPGK